MIYKRTYRIGILLLWLLVSFSTVYATDFTVNSTADTNTGSGTSGTLRWCINQANAAGAGPHTITFDASLSGGTILLTVGDLPVLNVSDVTIDGDIDGDGTGDITIDAGSGDNGTYVFRGGAGAINARFNGFTIQDTGRESFSFSGSPSGITIENIVTLNSSGNFQDYAVYYGGNADGLTVRNFTHNNGQSSQGGIRVTGTANNVTIDNFDYQNGSGGTAAVIWIQGAATNISILNSTLDLDMPVGLDDGDFGILFDSTATAITVNNVTVHDAEASGFRVLGVATDISITNAIFDNFDGWEGNQMIRFNNVVNGLTMANVDIDLNKTDNGTSTDDGDYGIYFMSHLNQDTTKNAIFTNVSINQADLNAVLFDGIVNNTTFEGCTFTGNSETSSRGYGIQFNNSAAKTNITINNNTFTGLASLAIFMDMDGTDATSNNAITNNTISGTVSATHPGYGIWLWDRDAPTDLIISGNTIHDNAAAAIRIERADGVNITQNSIYNNPFGIENANNTGNNDLQQADGDTPSILSSVNVGVDTYEVTFITPPVAVCNPCEVEFFTNAATDAPNNGRTYVHTETGLAGGTTYTSTINSGGENSGFWTTTMKSSNLNNSVSEYGVAYSINPVGPGGVADSSIRLWLKADQGITGTTVDTWANQASFYTFDVAGLEVTRQPTLVENGLNFNPAVDFDDDVLSLTNNVDSGSNFEYIVVIRPDANETFGIIDTAPFPGNNSFRNFNSGGVELWNNNPAIGMGLSAQTPYVLDFDISRNGFRNLRYYRNSADITTQANGSNFGIGWGDDPKIGNVNGDSNRSYNGKMAEVIIMDRDLLGLERARIISYLSIKYGITLLDTDYLASDRTVLWNAAANTTYNNDIAGIGRDDASALNQKQSKSENAGAMVTIGLGTIANTNVTNTGTFVNDKHFLLWGNDAGSTDLQATGLPAGALAMRRIGRQWRVRETGLVNNLSVRFENLPISPEAFDFELYIDTDGDGNFTNATVVTGGTVSEGAVSFTGVDLNEGDVFTVGLTNPAPGGVADNLTTWLRADTDTGTTSNLITNGNFSNGTTDWTVTGNHAIFGGRLTFNSFNRRPNALAEQAMATTTGAPYSLRFELGGQNNTNMRVRMDIVDGATNTVIVSQIYGNGQYGYNTIRFSAASTNTIIRIHDASTATFSQDVWVDNIVVFDNFTNVGDGDTVNVWSDQSTVGNDGVQITAGNTPIFSTGRLTNFNPSVEFATPDAGASNANKDYMDVIDANARGAYWVAVNDDHTALRHFLYGNDGGNVSNGFHGGNTGAVNNAGVPGAWRKNGINGSENDTWTGGVDMFSVETIGNEIVANIGGNQNGNPGRSWDGTISEVILYDASNDNTNRDKIESYLAIKYGLTIGHDYYASDWDGTTGTTLWTLGGGYDNDIAGIGRDDLSVLNQKQSRSVNADAIVTIGLGTIAFTNAANTNAFANDRNFLVWGNDNASLSILNVGIPPAFAEKINRNWRVNETGNVGNVLLQVPNTAVTGFTTTTDLTLFVADDAGFTANLEEIPLMQNGANWEATVDFNGVRFFAIGLLAPTDFMRHGKHFQGGTEQRMKF